MRYYKEINDGYISAIGTGNGFTEITEAEYDEIVEILHNQPTPPDGYDYRLKENLEWELYELPPEPEPELSDDEALAILLGGAE